MIESFPRTINAEIRQPTTVQGILQVPLSWRTLTSPQSERQKFNTDLASALTKSLQTMLTHTSSERGRTAVPLITNAQGISPFPVKIVVKVGGIEVG